ncbi:hypothetical protein CY652_11470 [Burkholderia sp. WAC0059]|uniref:hypothetical protein n=1 Tax=Burkholderia sp. WAC0059 TaxID=2066022 RepID=UPI000C7E9FAF|nr:hypothetical protein [Burkholderia sp. WAC0059]PLZ02345.1 hypothetical protein CY652_11470 [Burkholderia sp. WAC0059]
MISARAAESFERIFRQSARTRLPAREGSPCEIEPAAPADAASIGREPSDIMVLTISSMTFRLLMALQFRDDEPTSRHYRGDDERPLLDALMEVSNLCCGALNQQLVEHFPDLGMSTPYVLGGRSLGHFDELKPAHLAAYRVTIDGAVEIGATLCICANAPIDFDAQIVETETADAGGELELF